MESDIKNEQAVPTSVSAFAHNNHRLETVNLGYESVSDPRHTITDQDYAYSSIFVQDNRVNIHLHTDNNTAGITLKNDPAIVDNPSYSTSSGPPLVDNPAYIAPMKYGPGTTTEVLSHYNNNY